MRPNRQFDFLHEGELGLGRRNQSLAQTKGGDAQRVLEIFSEHGEMLVVCAPGVGAVRTVLRVSLGELRRLDSGGQVYETSRAR